MAKFQELIEFVDRAKRSRKYPDATAYSLGAALRLYEAELNEEERSSIEKVNKDFEQITRSVFSKNQGRFTASSLATYKSRVQKVLSDFEKYSDPVKMNNWAPRVVVRAKKAATSTASKKDDERSSGRKDEIDELSIEGATNVHRIDFSLRENTRVLILLPRDITRPEVDQVKAIIDAMVGISN
jgi:hypothetical protein